MSISRIIRDAVHEDTDACLELWVLACTARDGAAVAGVAERAAAKFENSALWLVAASGERVDGFALATVPMSGAPSDPADAAVLGLLAVSPQVQGSGLGRQLLRAVATRLAGSGYRHAVLHVLVDNLAAVRLYESEGWQRHDEPFEHALLHRMSQSYTLVL